MKLIYSVVLTAIVCTSCRPADTQTGSETGSETSTDTTDTEETSGVTVYSQTDGVLLLEGGIVTCENPENRELLGPMYEPDLGDEWASQLTGYRWPLSKLTKTAPGFGLSVSDFNGDGYLDVFLPMFGPNALYFGTKEGTLVNVTNDFLLGTTETPASEGSVVADFDGDGDPDLLVLNRGLNALFDNDGTGKLVIREDPFSGVSWETVGASVGDLNRDGRLDIVTANRPLYIDMEAGDFVGQPNQLLLGTSDGFAYADDWFPKGSTTGYTFIASIVDIDDDGWPDVYVLNDFLGNKGNILLRNRGELGPPFEDISVETYLGIEVASMGVGIGDINGDLIPDFVISDLSDPPLLESLDDGSWLLTSDAREITTELDSNVIGNYASWGLLLEDMDNDGWLDIPIAMGPMFAELAKWNPSEQPDCLFLRQEDIFVDVAESWGVAHKGNNRGIVAVDMNNDGWLDLLRRDINGITTVHYSRCGLESWVKIDLQQNGFNSQAIGAKVELIMADKTQVRWVQAGSTGLSSSGPSTLHYGLGETNIVPAIRITWPDGEKSVFLDVVAQQTLTFVRDQ